MMDLTFGLFTQMRDSGPQSPLVSKCQTSDFFTRNMLLRHFGISKDFENSTGIGEVIPH